jgi:ABC-2 type transport system ATP-binding protein
VRIETREVAKRFGRTEALRGVSFEAPAGTRLALIGPNGSGKSTLNRVLMGLLACGGSVLLDGRSPFRERVAVARRMAYVPQAMPHLGASVGEVVASVARVRGLSFADVEEVAGRFDLRLAEVARTPVRSLSGGTKQKLLLALAFAARASLLILDEPTGSLDSRSRERFFELVDALPAQTTVLLCSHRLEEVRPLVGSVLALDEGRVRYFGAAAAFLEACTVSLVEVWAEGEPAHAWLRARGFRETAAGYWLCTTRPAEKTRLLAELPGGLGAGLRHVNARDLERLELAESGATEPAGDTARGGKQRA